ncbi:MAG: Cna B-type domain-containing protein, partial [Oscillospiraceae bacterium]|nr:Cna B-type domain-containing protein [Oscillospiraceae bacterium]
LGNSAESISIGFTLTATVSTTQKRVTLNIPQKLNSGNSYEYAIDAGDTVMDTDGNQYSLSELEDYSISESLTSAQSEIADKYVFSPAYEMSNSMGVIKLINTSNLPDKTNITVNKVWIGGRTDAVTVQLYQTQVAGLTSAQIAALPTLSGGGEATPVGSPETLNSENSFTKTWSNQANFDENGVQYYYYVKETSTFEGVTASYEVSVTNTEQKTIITNQEEGKITVIKNWAGMDTLNGDDGTSYQQDVTVELKYSSDGTNWNSFQPSKTLELTSGNSWTDSFTGLAKTDSSSNPIRYKIFERSIGNNQVSDGETQKAGYTISYSDNNSAGVTLNKIASQTITVTNTLATVRIRMVKQWADGEAEHTNEAVTVILNRSTDAQSAPAVTTIASSTESTTTTTTTTTEEQTETETTSFDEKTLYNTEYTHPINNTVSSITIVFDEVSNSGGIDFSIGGVWSKWFWKNNGVLTASYGSGNESYNVSGNTITINFENGGRNVANIKLSAKDMTLGDLWKIASITFVIAGSSSEETTAPSSSTEQTATTTKTVTVGQNFSYQSDGYKVILDSNTIFEAGSQVILHLKSNDNTGNHLFQVAISGNGSNGWINVPKKSEADQGYTGSLNNDGEGTASITIPENLRDVQIQLWNYKEIADDWSSSSIDKEKLTLVSYTITPSSSGNSPRPPQQSSPKPPALTAKSVTAVTAPLASSVMGTQRIYRKGKLAQVEEVIEENQNIASVSAALAVMPRIRMFGYALSSPWSQTVTLSSSGEWSEEITLPAYDENGNPYYYWATETTVQGYTASYQFDDGDSGTIFCINAGNAGIAPQITILNTKTETESTDLPEAGGKGTSPYKAAGFLLMLTAVTFPYIKRKTRNT